MTTDANPALNEAASRGLVSSPVAAGVKRAVIYLRVSSTAQVNTDFDPEGISIPAQRQSCLRKAAQSGDVEIVGEYVEPGRSGTSMDGRPAFQAMLQRIREERDVDQVIIYKLSRMNRNRVDDALVMMQLRKYGVSLVSATEMIDDTPEGQLMHGVLASFNEFRSAADGADIRYKMSEKAKRGGTLGRAPLGYLNVRETFEGREVRTVAFDPERAPLIRQAFDLYATGEHTLQSLCDELTNRGLRTRPGRYPAGPISDSKLSTLLQDRYYLGVVTHKGEEYPGRHQPLITPEVFDAVQQVLDGRRTAGERQRVHHHYLKGSIWCGACHRRGRESRLLIQKSTGRGGGTYFYFFCSAKQHRACDEPYLSIDGVVEAVEHHYASLVLDPDLADAIRTLITDVVSDDQTASKLRAQQIAAKLTRLDVQEENLLDLAADGDLPTAKVRQRLRKLGAERAELEALQAGADDRLDAGAAVLTQTLGLLGQPDQLYRRSDDQGRRLLNQAIFTKLYVERDVVTGDEVREPFEAVVELDRALRSPEAWERGESVEPLPIAELAARMCGQTQRGRTQIPAYRPLLGSKASLLATALSGSGSSKDAMVGDEGLEPPTLSV